MEFSGDDAQFPETFVTEKVSHKPRTFRATLVQLLYESTISLQTVSDFIPTGGTCQTVRVLPYGFERCFSSLRCDLSSWRSKTNER